MEYAVPSVSWRGIAAVVVLCLLGGCSSRSLHGQKPTVPELVQPIPGNGIQNPTREQAERLNRIRSLPTTGSVYLVSVNDDALKADRLAVSIPEGEKFVLVKTGGETQNSEQFTWLGAMQDIPKGNATLVLRNGNLTGSLTSTAGLYQITPVGGGVHAIIKVDTRKMPPEEPPLSEPKK